MLVELRVRELGVISDLDVVLGPGLTVLTGETGAGKTLVVEALGLLLGGRGDPSMVRAGSSEALVEGRFEHGDEEVVLARAIPSSGRSRAFVDGRMAPLSSLEGRGRELVDLYGQHAHHSLLRPSLQRAALDRFVGVDLAPLQGVRRKLAGVVERLASLGGDDRTRLRELDLLRFELTEIDAAGITSLDEDEILEAREQALAEATALRQAASLAHDILAGGTGGGALDQVGDAIAALGRHGPLAEQAVLLRSLQCELGEAVTGLRTASEAFEEDPVQLEAVRARRHLLRGLVRKHGDSIGDVLAAASTGRSRIADLEANDAIRAGLDLEREALLGEIGRLEETVGNARRAGAPALAAAVERHLEELALSKARLEIHLSAHGLADDVELFLGTNPGEPVLPLAKVASGGELARAMLALRLVLSSGPPTLVFDEVDAGIGGAAALAVGRALAKLSSSHQVLVVTHLAQVAAQADRHLVVEKSDVAGRTVARVAVVEGEDRVGELSRMLAGRNESSAGRRHAEELLFEARSSASPG